MHRAFEYQSIKRYICWAKRERRREREEREIERERERILIDNIDKRVR